MISLSITVALGLVSFISSMFVLFRLLLPILPPHPLSRRVPPSAFGLPNFGSLSPADKSHIYFACIDLLALGVFVWQVAVEQSAPASINLAEDPASAARLWFATTARQTCLCIVLLIAVVQIRQGRTVTLGPYHTFLLVPSILVVAAATVAAAVFAIVGVPSLFIGITAYSIAMAAVSAAAFLTLVHTIVRVRRHLSTLDDTWPPVKEKRKGSFATEDIEALKEGSSWITSHRSSRHNSVSSFAFSVRSALPSSHNSSARDRNRLVGSTATLPMTKNAYWFGLASSTELVAPPVPALPEQYQYPSSPVPSDHEDAHDPFRRDEPRFPRIPKSSSNSWLTEPSVSHPTMSEFSFPTTRPSSPAQLQGPSSGNLLPASATTVAFAPMPQGRVLGGYNYIPELDNRIKGLSSGTLAPNKDAPTSALRAVGWISVILVPIVLAAPYLLYASAHPTNIPDALYLLLVLSVTMSSPLLALNLVLHSPMPLPATLFPSSDRTKITPLILPSRSGSTNPYGSSSRANTPTVIEGRRSGDIWLERGDAVDGQSRIERIFAMTSRNPKLSVLPSECTETPQLTPPLPMQTREYNDMTMSMSMSEGSGFAVEQPSGTARNGQPVRPMRSEVVSKASSYYTSAPSTKEEIRIAQRHYSAMAMTVSLPPSSAPQSLAGDHEVLKRSSVSHSRSQSTSSAVVKRTSIATPRHSRSRSASSAVQTFPHSPTPPPDSPLPPTPDSLARARIRHVRAKSSLSSQYSFSPVTATAQIDGLSAGMLPLLVPGLKVNKNMVADDDWARAVGGSPAQAAPAPAPRPVQSQTLPKSTKISAAKTSTGSTVYPHSMSLSFSSPEHHSTPPVRPPRTSRSRSYHYSLPSLGLSKSANFISEIAAALTQQTQNMRKDVDDNRRKTMHGAGHEYEQLLRTRGRPKSTVSSRAASREPSVAPSRRHSRAPSREHVAAPRAVSRERAGPSVTPSPEFMTAMESVPRTRTANKHKRSVSASTFGSNRSRARSRSPAPAPERERPAPPVVGIDLDDPFVTPSVTPTSAVFPDSTTDAASIRSTRRVPVNPTGERPRAFHLPTTTSNRPPSSIIYIKSHDEAQARPPSALSRTSFAVVEEPEEPIKSLVSPWEGILSAAGALVSRSGSQSPEEPKKQLRPLRLLQDRDPNTPASPVMEPSGKPVRPLVVKKRSGGKQDENSRSASSVSPGSKTLRLVRTATAKARAKWQEQEALPSVVIRAPSNASTAGFHRISRDYA